VDDLRRGGACGNVGARGRQCPFWRPDRAARLPDRLAFGRSEGGQRRHDSRPRLQLGGEVALGDAFEGGKQGGAGALEAFADLGEVHRG
jgi:hypothetical protein